MNYAMNITYWMFERDNLHHWSLDQRLAWLKELDAIIQKNRDEICTTVAEDKSVSADNILMNEYTPVRLLIKYYLQNARRILADEDRSRPFSANFGAKKVIVKKEPLGVVGVISPFNYPFALAMGPTIAAIVAGNGAILKPAIETAGTNVLIKKLLWESLGKFEAEDLFWLLYPDTAYGKALVAEPRVAKIHFTGSVTAGREVAKANVEVRFIPPTLELGGSNPAIVLEDADLDEAARVIVWSRFCGLSCNSIKRVFVVKLVFDDFQKILSEQVKQISSDERVLKIPEREEKNFAHFLDDYACNSKSFKVSVTPHQGLEVRPVVGFLNEYESGLAILHEETFCPILPIVKVKNVEMAVKYSNDTIFGLGASVFTRNTEKFRQIADQLNCGTVCHNDALTEFAQPQVPFGGWKDSGWGYTHGPEGLLDFTQKKTIILEKNNLTTITAKKLGLWKLQLYPWTTKKINFLRKYIDKIIEFS